MAHDCRYMIDLAAEDSADLSSFYTHYSLRIRCSYLWVGTDNSQGSDSNHTFSYLSRSRSSDSIILLVHSVCNPSLPIMNIKYTAISFLNELRRSLMITCIFFQYQLLVYYMLRADTRDNFFPPSFQSEHRLSENFTASSPITLNLNAPLSPFSSLSLSLIISCVFSRPCHGGSRSKT